MMNENMVDLDFCMYVSIMCYVWCVKELFS